MHELYELKEKLLQELTEYSQHGKFSKDDAEVIKYLSSAIDHICNIVEAMEEEEGYLERGGSYSRDGGGGGSYLYSRDGQGGQGVGGGGSYRGGRGGRYSRNSYARGRGRNAKRDSMGRYSSEGGYSRADEGMEDMLDALNGMMQELPPEIQKDAQRLTQKLEEQMM